MQKKREQYKKEAQLKVRQDIENEKKGQNK